MRKQRKRHATGKYKGKLQTQIAALLFGVFVLYSLIFLPASLFTDVRQILGMWGETSTRLGLAISAVAVARP